MERLFQTAVVLTVEKTTADYFPVLFSLEGPRELF